MIILFVLVGSHDLTDISKIHDGILKFFLWPFILVFASSVVL